MFAIAALMGLTGSTAFAATDSLVTPADLDATRTLIAAYEKHSPINLSYGGQSLAKLGAKWMPVELKALDENRTQLTQVVHLGSEVDLRIVTVRYADFPAVEWTAYVKNNGKSDSKMIDDFRGIDASIAAASGDVVVHAEKGSDAEDNDYQPIPIPLAPNATTSLQSTGGRTSTGAAIPYFNFESSSGGACVAIGWPGQWDATFANVGGEIKVSAGQQQVHTILHPGEEIRTPLIAIVSYSGNDIQRGQNIWRRWMLAHNIPRVDGKFVGPFTAGVTSHLTAEMTKGTQANQIGYLNGYLKRSLPIEYWWMDAGWYVSDGTWQNTGTWKVDRKRFPGGLRAVTDYARSKGIKSIIWFEPERVTPHTELWDEHANFLLKAPLDANNPTAGLVALRGEGGGEPNFVQNTSDHERIGSGIHWPPHTVSMHPGPRGEFAVARYTFPQAGAYTISGKFTSADKTTTDDHLIFNGRSLFSGELTPDKKTELPFSATITAQAGQFVDIVVGYGSNHSHGFDSTLVSATISNRADRKSHDFAGEFSLNTNPNGNWTYGSFAAHSDLAANPKLNVFTVRDLGSNGSALLNLGNPEALAWITDRIDSMIKSEGIDVYRQDFNIEPLTFWRGGDSPNRQGMTENFYVQGYLKFWDALLERNPKIYIDSCASGGRRNDLETMRRSVPFLRSDRQFNATGQQGQSYGLFSWIPFNGTGTLVGASMQSSNLIDTVDAYQFRSDMSSIYTLACYNDREPFDYARDRQLIEQYRALWPSYSGDYFPLTPYSLDTDKWIGWQFVQSEKQEGFVQIFRREHATAASLKVKLRGLKPDASYSIYDVDHEDQKRTMAGSALMNDGLDIAIATQPGAAIIRFAPTTPTTPTTSATRAN